MVDRPSTTRRVANIVFAIVMTGLSCLLVVPFAFDIPDPYFQITVVSAGVVGLVISFFIFPWLWEQSQNLTFQSITTFARRSSLVCILGAIISGAAALLLNPSWGSWVWSVIFPVLAGSLGLSILAVLLGIVALAINRDRRAAGATGLGLISAVVAIAVLVFVAFMHLGKHPI